MRPVQNLARKELGVPEKKTPAPAPPGNQRAIRLVGEWLNTFDKYNTRLTYSSAIGYPYTPSGKPRSQPVTAHSGHTWLAWCTTRDINPISVPRRDVEAWWTEVRTTPKLAEQTRLLLARALSAFSLWAVRNHHTTINIGAWVDQTLVYHDTDQYRQRQAPA